MMKRIFFIILFLLFFSGYCKSYEKIPDDCYKIDGIFGPEDFVFLEKENIFLISSHNRRNFELLGEIYSYNLSNNELKAIPRIGEPKDLSFRPHGIDFYNEHLYIILHGKELKSKWHGVGIYKWNGKELIFVKLIENELFHSPNDIAVYSDSTFFLTNDSRNRGSLWEFFLSLSFGINKGSIVFCNIQKNECKYAVEKLGFPNGIVIYKDMLFASTTFEHKIYRFNIEKDFELTNKSEIAKVKGGDNLIISNNKLYVTSHPSFWKFLKHSSNTENTSPSIGYEIDLENYNKKIIFSDEGSRLSASSVILKLNQNIYIGQVFDPFLLYCKTP